MNAPVNRPYPNDLRDVETCARRPRRDARHHFGPGFHVLFRVADHRPCPSSRRAVHPTISSIGTAIIP